MQSAHDFAPMTSAASELKRRRFAERLAGRQNADCLSVRPAPSMESDEPRESPARVAGGVWMLWPIVRQNAEDFLAESSPEWAAATPPASGRQTVDQRLIMTSSLASTTFPLKTTIRSQAASMKTTAGRQVAAQARHTRTGCGRQLRLFAAAHTDRWLLTCCLLALLALGGQAAEETTVRPESLAADTLAPSLELLAPSPLESPNNQSSNKLKPVNFTLVDEVFDSVLSEDEVVKRWRNMDSQLQDGMKSILKMLFPQIVALSQDAKVSGECSGGILKWILSLRNLRSWAIKSKPTAGMFEGSLTMFGNYRQCLNIRAPDEDEIEITDQFEEYFRGQFCVLHLKPWMPIKRPFYHVNSSIESLLRKNYKYYEKTLYDELAEIAIAFNFIDIRMDLCVPSTCTIADIQRVAELLSKKLEMRAKVMRCDIAARQPGLLNQLDRPTIYWLALPLALALAALCATLFHWLIPSKPHQQGSISRRTSMKDFNPNHKGSWERIFEALSIAASFHDRLTCPTSRRVDDEQVVAALPKKPLPLYGLRNLFVLWFILIQMTVELKYQYLRESMPLRDMIISHWPFQIIVNSVLLFESLILITAFTYGYTGLESTFRDLIGYIVDKYVRLVPAIATMVALTIATPLLNIESPVWRNFVEQQANVCKSTGYLNLLFLQNFISYENICLPHTWLFCVEMQLILLSLPILLMLKSTFLSTEDKLIVTDDKSGSPSLLKLTLSRLICSKVGLLSSLLMALGAFANFFIVYSNQLPPSWFYTFPDVAQKNYYFGLYLIKTWTHLSVFMVGLLAGHLCRSTLQLRNVKLLKSRQQVQQPSPVPSAATDRSQLASMHSHGSTSTIMAMDMSTESERTEDSSSEAQSTGRRASVASEHRKSALLRLSFQVAALSSMAAILFSTFTWSTQETPSPLVAALYDSLSRLVWSTALVGLMIQLCTPNSDTSSASPSSDSFITRTLCHPLLHLLGRLSFLAYLISPYVNTFVLAVEEQSLFPSLFIIFHVIVGNIVITYTLAFVLAIVIEQPLRRLLAAMRAHF